MNEIEEYTRNGLTVQINYDDDPENPRDWDNVGTMICSHRNYKLGDEQFNADDYEGWDDLEKHLREERKAVIVLPLALYDHSGISMHIGTGGGWDSGQVGFIYVTQEDIDKEWQGEDRNKQAEKYLEMEVKTYNQYLTGDVYGLVITNPKTDEEIDSCWGFFGLEYVKERANEAADNFTHPHEAAYALNAKQLHV